MRVLVAQNATTDPIGALGPPLVDASFDLDVWHAPAETPPRDLGEYAAVVALGGSTNPDEEHAWLRAERDLLREAVRRGLPVIAVCLGAQLLSQALGGRAPRLPRTRIGWFPLTPGPATAHDPLGEAWRSLDQVLEWHTYRFTLPPGGELLAGTPDAVQAFRAGPSAWGFQYHLEADPPLLSGWTRFYHDELVAEGADPEALAEAGHRLGAGAAAHGTAVGQAFAELLTRRRALTGGQGGG